MRLPLLYLAGGTRRERAAPEKIALLLEAGADPNTRNDEADTPLHAVVARGGVRAAAAAAALLEACADVNARNSEGWTPLHNAVQPAEGDTIPMVLVLLQAGADVNARTHLGETPLHLAVSWRQTRHTSADRAHVITALLEAGAEVDARTSDGWTPLQVALQADRAAEVVKLLEAGADPAARDGAGILADPAGCRHWGAPRPSSRSPASASWPAASRQAPTRIPRRERSSTTGHSFMWLRSMRGIPP